MLQASGAPASPPRKPCGLRKNIRPLPPKLDMTTIDFHLNYNPKNDVRNPAARGFRGLIQGCKGVKVGRR